MKTVIIGLPLFTKRLSKDLSEFDPENSYLSLDTYYRFFDKIKALVLVPKADCIYSINGSITTSRVFDLAIKNSVPLIMHWVGTDVLKAKKAFKSGEYRKDYIENGIHFCEVEWIRDEIMEIGIKAEIVNFVSFNKKYEKVITNVKPLTILSYIPEKRRDFYGLPLLLNLANKFPDINFIIVGSSLKDIKNIPANIKAMGWIKDMEDAFNRSHICFRFPEHDGLSSFILESLARGKQVIYKYPFEGCVHAPTISAVEIALSKIQNSFISGKYQFNLKGASFIQNNFGNKLIMERISNRIKEISNR